MPDNDLMAWLGPAAEQLTAEQIERMAEESDRVNERYPDPDEQRERDAAMSAVVQYLLGETSPDEVNRTLIDARLKAQDAYAAALAVGVQLVRDGSEKATAARAVGVSRMSLLEALGERKR